MRFVQIGGLYSFSLHSVLFSQMRSLCNLCTIISHRTRQKKSLIPRRLNYQRAKRTNKIDAGARAHCPPEPIMGLILFVCVFFFSNITGISNETIACCIVRQLARRLRCSCWQTSAFVPYLIHVRWSAALWHSIPHSYLHQIELTNACAISREWKWKFCGLQWRLLLAGATTPFSPGNKRTHTNNTQIDPNFLFIECYMVSVKNNWKLGQSIGITNHARDDQLKWLTKNKFMSMDFLFGTFYRLWPWDWIELNFTKREINQTTSWDNRLIWLNANIDRFVAD